MVIKEKKNKRLPGSSAHRPVAELLEHFRLRPETRVLLPKLNQLSPQAAFAELYSRRIYADAIRLLAISLPKPAAVWWGTLCAWDLYRQPTTALLPEPTLAGDALAASLDWVRYPREVTRRAAERAGREAKASTAAGALALAAAWSDGSLAPMGLPAVPPAWYLTGKLTAGALLLTAACKRPYDLHIHYRRYLEIGIAIAAGRLLWPALTSSEAAIVAGLDEESHNAHGRNSLGARTQLDSAGASREFLVDPASPTPPKPNMQTTLLTAREQLAKQLEQIDTMLQSGHFV
jgi:hypothetical protein